MSEINPQLLVRRPKNSFDVDAVHPSIDATTGSFINRGNFLFDEGLLRGGTVTETGSENGFQNRGGTLRTGFVGGENRRIIENGVLRNFDGGTVEQQAAIKLANGIILNDTGGIYDMRTSILRSGDTASAFMNRGGMLKKTGTANTEIKVLFTMVGGAVEVNEGILTFSRNAIHEGSGSFTVNKDATLRMGVGVRDSIFRSDYAITGEGTVLFEGALVSERTLTTNLTGPGKMVIQGVVVGGFSGEGTISGPRFSHRAGLIDAGSSPGILTFNVDVFEQFAGGAIRIELAGSEPGSGHDVINFSGDVILGGPLELVFIDEFSPTQGQQFEFMSVEGALSGAFSDMSILGLRPGFQFGLTPRDGGGLMLTTLAVPLPILSDLTNNGFVDADDLFVLLGNWDTLCGPQLGDLFDDPAKPGINADDLFVLLGEWTEPDPRGPAAAVVGAPSVPEPSALVLAVLGILSLCMRRRRSAK